ncbi:AFG1/ZapE family ATPase [Gemmobacter lanyuensis]
MVIVTTSNRPPEDLYKNGLNRALFLPFIDFLRDKLIVHELESPNDYRQHRLQGRRSISIRRARWGGRSTTSGPICPAAPWARFCACR